MVHNVVNVEFHADDLGMNERINTAIENLLATGRLAGVSIMANMPATEEGAKVARRYPGVRMDAHLNLTEGRPLRPASTLGHLVDRTGQLPGLPRLVAGLMRGRIDVAAIRAELAAQLDRLEGLGVALSGVDTHHHAHAFAPISDVVEELAAERNLRCWRSYDQLRTYTARGRGKKVVAALAAKVTEWQSSRAFELPGSWQHPARPFAVASWERLPVTVIQQSGTIVCHPGNGCDLRPSRHHVEAEASPASTKV